MKRLVPEIRLPWIGRDRLEPRKAIPRHRHRHGYIAVVLAGGYQEAGYNGRRNLSAGHVMVHQPHDAHLDYVAGTGAEVLNLPLPADCRLSGAFAIDDPDAVARMAERSPVQAVALLQPIAEIGLESDWADCLAADLLSNPDHRLDAWAREAGLAPETLSRGFRAAYGLTPARFRIEVRARRAMLLIEQGDGGGLAQIAVECGFADQSHLTRAIVELTGQTPGNWRRSNSFKKRLAMPG